MGFSDNERSCISVAALVVKRMWDMLSSENNTELNTGEYKCQTLYPLQAQGYYEVGAGRSEPLRMDSIRWNAVRKMSFY